MGNDYEYPSYEGALAAAGAEVLAFQQFGSYQGEWWAKVRYKREIGWVQGYYGSCSGCDALQGSIDTYDRFCAAHWYDRGNSSCDDCRAALATWEQAYADFGRSLIEPLYSQDEALVEAGTHIDWDSDAQKMVDFITQHPLEATE